MKIQNEKKNYKALPIAEVLNKTYKPLIEVLYHLVAY